MKRTDMRIFVIAVLLCMAVTPVAAYDIVVANDDGKTIYYDFIKNNTELEVSDWGSNSYAGNIVIPSTVTYGGRNYSVTSIKESAFSYCSNLTSISIPNSVTTIGESAFLGCSNLKSISIPSSVTSIERFTFNGCLGLTSISIPNSVNNIGGFAFNGCSGLTSISIPNSVTSIGECAFQGCSGLTSISIPSSLTSIGNYTFANCRSLTSAVTIPSGVTSIGNAAFTGCSGLTFISIPNSVTSIGDRAFNGCSGLTFISIPNSVTSIGDRAFNGCSSLTSISIPSSVTSIGESAFSGCRDLISIEVDANNNKYDSRENSNAIIETSTNSLVAGCRNTVVPSSVTSIGGSAFSGCSGLTSISIPSSVTSIGGSAFSGCSGLTSISIPSSVMSIGESAFSYCSNLTSIYIPNSVTSIRKSAFFYCSFLTSISIPNSVITIGESAFEGCSGLPSISIPNSVKNIGDRVFWGCSGLTFMSIPNNVTSIGNSAFSGCSGLTSISIPNSVTSIGESAFHNCSGLTSVSIPSSVTSIGDRAFNGCSGLTSISIPSSVTSIGNSAFYNCSGLTSVSIPSSVTSIGNYVFYGCSGLTSISIPNSVTSIGNYVFYGCSGLTSISIPNSVTSIGDRAFSSCSGLTSISIPNSVTSIRDAAFAECTSLTSVTSLIAEPFEISLNVFSGTDLPTLYVPAFALGAYRQTAGWNEFTNIKPIEENTSTMALQVKNETDEELSEGLSIIWYDKAKSQIGTGSTIGGINNGDTVYYSVTLNEELGRVYREVFYQQAVVDGNPVVCQLVPIETVQLRGQVLAMGTEVAHAVVNITQWLNGRYIQSMQTKTDAGGRFTVEAKNDSTEIVVQYPGYTDYQLTQQSIGSGEVGKLYLEPVRGKVIVVSLSYQEAAAEGAEPIVQDWYSDTRNVAYTLYNNTKGKDLTDFSMQQGNIVLQLETDTGDRISMTAHSLNGKFADVSAETTIAANDTAEVSLRLIAYGGVDVSYSQKRDERLLAMLYDADGNLVARSTFAGYNTSFSQLSAGHYTLVTMGSGSGVNSVATLGDLALMRLTEGTDYAVNNLTVSNGVLTNVYVESVPEMDASKFELTSANISYLPNKTQTTAGRLMTMTAHLGFHPQYTGQISDVQLVVTIPKGCVFIDNSVCVGTTIKPYTLNGDRLTIPLNGDETDSRVHFCLMPTQSGTFTSTALAVFDYQGERTLAIGTAIYEATGEAIYVPSLTREKTITVSGVSASKAEVDIYDGGHLIGTTIAKADGTWNVECELHNAYNLTTHEIYAQYRSPYQQIVVKTATQECLYNTINIVTKSVTMTFYNGWLKKNVDVTFNFENGTTSNNSYQFYTSTDFTFVADLTTNNNTSVNGVTFYVHTTQKEVRQLKGFFDEKLSRWVAVSKFDSNNLPVNVSVEVAPNYSHFVSMADHDELSDNMNGLTKAVRDEQTKISELDKQYANIGNEKEPTVIDRIAVLLAGVTDEEPTAEEQNQLKQLMTELLDSYPSEGDNEEIDEEALLAEYQQIIEDVENFFIVNSKDSIYKALNINSLFADFDSEQTSYSGIVEGENLLYSMEKVDILDEAELLALGYRAISTTDGSVVYCQYGDSEIAFIDMNTGMKYSCQQTEAAMARGTSRVMMYPAYTQFPFANLLKDVLELYSEYLAFGSSPDKLDLRIEMIDRILSKTCQLYTEILSWTQSSWNKTINDLYSGCSAWKSGLEVVLKKSNIELFNWYGVYETMPNNKNIYGRVGEYVEQIFDLQNKLEKIEGFERWVGNVAEKIRNSIYRLPKSPVDGGKAVVTGGKILGVFGSLAELIGIYCDLNDAREDFVSWNNLRYVVDSKEPCPKNSEKLQEIKQNVKGDIQDLIKTYDKVLASEVTAFGIDVASLTVITNPLAELTAWFASGAFNIYAEWTKYFNTNSANARFIDKQLAYWQQIGNLKCEEDEPDEETPADDEEKTIPKKLAPEPTTNNVTPIHDPSGYVYEAVTSNRLSGVMATIYEQETDTTPWDAEDYSQVNPQVTDETGLYRWDVPMGNWQVRFVKEGYETVQTEWLPVPPPQLEINIPMSQGVAPEVTKAYGTESGITMTFSKYMRPATVEENGRVTAQIETPSPLRTGDNAAKAGDAVTGSLDMVDLEEDPYTSQSYASKVMLVPEKPLKAGDVVLLTVKKDVENYCGVTMDADQTLRVVIEPDMGIQVDSLIVIDYGSTHTLDVTVSPASATAGKVLQVMTTSPLIASVDHQEVTLDAEGRGQIVVGGELPGSASVQIALPEADLQASTEVYVVRGETVAHKPKASKPTDSTVGRGFQLKLTTSTAGATIYYTLDGSDPTESATRKTYSAPIVLKNDVTVKAVATRDGLKDSPVGEFVYTVISNEVVIDEMAATVPESADDVDVRVKRTMDGGVWSTLVLPFDMSETQVKTVFGSDVQIAQFTGWRTTERDGNGQPTAIEVNFSRTSSITANVPVIIKATRSISEFAVDDVNVNAETLPAVSVGNEASGTAGSFTGSYVPMTLPSGSLFLYDNKFYYSVGKTQMKGLRAFFNFQEVLSEMAIAESRVKIVIDGSDATGINDVTADCDGSYYNLQGLRVKKPQGKGVYIERSKGKNGKKVINK